jgi:zinc/manganese transport system permease protein
MDDFAIFWPALAAGLLVAATHVPLGIEVLKRGIVFIDLAMAQFAGLGVVLADWAGFEHHGAATQVAGLSAALAGAFLLSWTERRWPQVQEAIIGVSFIAAANVAILLLAANPQGSEHLKHLLVGQILWVSPAQVPLVALTSAVILATWLWRGERLFYLLFACAVTVSVQLVGLYLVFATLIVPALATRGMRAGRLTACYAVAAIGYLAGLVLSTLSDLPAGPLIVCALTSLGIGVFALGRTGDKMSASRRSIP